MVGSEVFCMKPTHRFVYPNEENEFMVPNHQKKGDYYVNPWDKGDYYVNPCLSQLKDKS